MKIDDYEEVLSDHRRLVREMDEALSGEGNAAKQASLCDLIPQAKRMREALVQIEEILYDDLANRPSERARKAVMNIVAKALYG